MNAHLRNFRDALVFADECKLPTQKLWDASETIVAELLMSCALAVQNFDSQTPDEDAENFIMYETGSAAFHIGIAATMGDDTGALNDWPSLREFAAKIRSKYL